MGAASKPSTKMADAGVMPKVDPVTGCFLQSSTKDLVGKWGHYNMKVSVQLCPVADKAVK